MSDVEPQEAAPTPGERPPGTPLPPAEAQEGLAIQAKLASSDDPPPAVLPAETIQALQDRSLWGIVLVLVGMLGIAVLLGVSAQHLAAMPDQLSKFEVFGAFSHWAFSAFALSHALIALAGVWFCYQVIRAGERMLFPAHWVDQMITREPRFLVRLLGVQDPASMLARAAAAAGEKLGKK